jgi:predicted HD phosphohydrolase
LARQGGPTSLTEVEAFEAHPWTSAATRLRCWDDLAKVPGATTLSLAELRPIFEELP